MNAPTRALSALLAMFFFALSAKAAEPAAVRAGSELDFRPYCFTDQDGQPTGFGVELLRAVADKMGLRLEITTGPWDERWADLVAGRIDVLPVVARTPGREPLVDFSLPHTETFDAFFVREGQSAFPDLAAAAGKQIVVLRDDAAHHQLVERTFAGQIIPVESIPEGLRLIAAGRHDAFLCSKMIGLLEMRSAGIRGMTAGPPIPDYKRAFSFGVRKGHAELLEKLNQGLLIVKTDGTYDRIYRRWLTVEDPWSEWLPYFKVVVVGLLVLGGLVVLLQWLVRRRTRELKRATVAMEAEVAERRHAEAALQQMTATLEQRVADRTAELQASQQAALKLMRDATEARTVAEQASAALAASEQRIQQALQVSHSFTFEWHLATDEVLRSASCAPILGLTGDEAVSDTGRNYFQRVHPDDRAGFVQLVSGLTPAAANFTVEYRVVRPDGRIVMLEEIGQGNFDAAGKLERLVGVTTDITARRQAEEALLAAHRQTQELIDNSTAMVYACDLEERFVLANAALAALLKTTPAQLVGKRRHEFMPRADADAHEAADREVIAAGRAVEFEERSDLHGRSITWLSTKFPLRDAQGRIYAVAGIVTDISERKRAEDALRVSLQEKEVLLKEVHHRVKNNLQVISSLISLQMSGVGEPAMQGLLADVRDRVRTMALVHEKLYQSSDLSRIEFAGYIQSLLNHLWNVHCAPSAPIRLTLNLVPMQLTVETAVPCGLILNELATNALKHAFHGREDGQVTVSLRAEGARVSLCVRDDGVGLPAGLEWRQAKTLGLRLVQMLSGQLRGAVDARAVEGGGTEFEVAFDVPTA